MPNPVHAPTPRPQRPLLFTRAPKNGMAALIRVVTADGEVLTYSLGEIAHRTGLRVSTVSRIFGGTRTGKVSTLERIADAIGTSLDVLHNYLKVPRAKRRGLRTTRTR